MKNSLILLSFFLLVSLNSHSQSLGSLRNRLGDAMIDKAIDEALEDSDSENDDQNTSSTDESSNKPSQKDGGAGIDNSLDDVPTALAQASTEFSSKEYRSARTSLRKALRTLDTKIGEKMIASLPETVRGLAMKSDADKVTVSGESWNGLTVHREYQKSDTWTAITIYNGSASSVTTSVLHASLYSSYSDEDQKHIQIKGNDAVIRFSDSEGYTIGLSLGQQTFIAFEGVNVASESEMIAIAESFDLLNIKKTLGDQ